MNVSETSNGYKIELTGMRELEYFEKQPLMVTFGNRPLEFAYNACSQQAIVGANEEQTFISVPRLVYRDLLGMGKSTVKAKCRIPGKASEQTLDIIVLKEEVPQEVPDP
ncbi:MAG: hypothetical protein AABY01_04505, partial [Nanoarchaeota archaeon]